MYTESIRKVKDVSVVLSMQHCVVINVLILNIPVCVLISMYIVILRTVSPQHVTCIRHISCNYISYQHYIHNGFIF